MCNKPIRKVTVLGMGLMGCGIAQVFARCEDLIVYGYENFAPLPDVTGKIQSSLQLLQQNGVMTETEVSGILTRISVTSDLATAVEDADFIIECVPENMELKQNLFRDLDSMCKPGVILATNTSVMSITEIASKSSLRGRIVGTHFWNPPHLIPLVEVIKGDDTSESVMDATLELLRRVGKHPIRVNKDVPGFVANRLQHALWREAFSIVERGIADAATVDEAIRFGPGLRLPVLAPLENADMVGLDLTLAIHDYILKHLEDSHEPSLLLKEKVAAGELGFKTGCGFQTWTPEEADASRKRLSEYLIRTVTS